MDNEQLKKELKKFSVMYTAGPLAAALDQARLAIIDLEVEVRELTYWCQVAKDILPEEEFSEVQRVYELSEHD